MIGSAALVVTAAEVVTIAVLVVGGMYVTPISHSQRLGDPIDGRAQATQVLACFTSTASLTSAPLSSSSLTISS